MDNDSRIVIKVKGDFMLECSEQALWKIAVALSVPVIAWRLPEIVDALSRLAGN